MDTRDKQIMRVIFWDTLVLTLISAFEFAARLDGMLGPLKMFFRMAVGENIPLSRVMHYVDIGIFEAPLFLLLCFALGVTGLSARRSRKWSMILLAPSALLLLWGFTLRLTLFGDFIRILKLLPLVLLLLLSLARVIVRQPKPKPVIAPQPQVHVIRLRRRDRLILEGRRPHTQNRRVS